MEQREAELLPEKTYHIFNRTLDGERLFRSKENFRFFLRKYRQYIHPIAMTMAFCLMPAHFHFMVRIREDEELLGVFKNKRSPGRVLNPARAGWHPLLSKQFSNFFNSYTQAFNKLHGRRGNLLLKVFKRKDVRNEVYFRKLVHYIHLNPVQAGYCDRPEEWSFSSFAWFAGLEPWQGSEPCQGFMRSILEKEKVLSNFGGRENFIRVHRDSPFWSGVDQR